MTAKPSNPKDLVGVRKAPISKDFYAALNAAAGAILDRHADKNPRHFTIADSVREGD